MLQQAGHLVTNFSAQTACREDLYESLLADLQFFTLAAEQIDWKKMAAAAKTLSRLTEESWLKQLTTLAGMGLVFGGTGNDHYEGKRNRTNGHTIIDHQGSSLFVDH